MKLNQRLAWSGASPLFGGCLRPKRAPAVPQFDRQAGERAKNLPQRAQRNAEARRDLAKRCGQKYKTGMNHRVTEAQRRNRGRRPSFAEATESKRGRGRTRRLGQPRESSERR